MSKYNREPGSGTGSWESTGHILRQRDGFTVHNLLFGNYDLAINARYGHEGKHGRTGGNLSLWKYKINIISK